MFRYHYDGGHLVLDHGWGPVTYRTGAQMPGTAPGILGDYVVIQTNFLPSLEPLTVTAADVHDGSRPFSITPAPSASQKATAQPREDSRSAVDWR